MKIINPFAHTCFRLILGLALTTACIRLHEARAEYHNFNTGGNCDGLVQEVRWPYWAESTYNAIYSQSLSGSDGGSCYFYGGMPSDSGGNSSIIWSFWPPSGTAVPGAAVTAYWTAPNMYAPPHVGEGASGKVSGSWPLIKSNLWYREVLRVWKPADGTPHLGYAGRWLRDSATSNWYHVATMEIPFSATGINGLSGFQEDFGNGNARPRRTDYRNVYYHNYSGGAWQMANRFTPSVRQINESGACGVIENATAAFFETCSGSTYLYTVASNLPPTTGDLVMLVSTNTSASLLTNHPPGVTTVAHSGNYAQFTCIITNQPVTPAIDPIIVSATNASVSGAQLITTWQLPQTSSPQFAYKVEVFNNSGYTGTAAVAFYGTDPEARQKMLDIAGVATPYVRLTIIDIYNVTNTPIQLTPGAAALSAASNVVGAVNGLTCNYYESSTNFSVLPNFSALTPVYKGAVDYPDLTLRRQRSRYAFTYTGFVNVPADGLYTFTLDSSDGSRLVIDGATVVDWDGQHSPAPKSGWAALAAGKHAVSLQYFFNTQQLSGELIDKLEVLWSGPGISAPAPVPSSAWFRAAAGSEPAITLTAPADGATICGSNVLFTSTVTPNGFTANKVQYYIGNNYWGQDSSAPYTLNSFVWAASSNTLRARLFYNSTNILDSAQNLVSTTNMTLAPWLLASMSEHVYPNGARIAGGNYTLIGDGLNLLGRRVTGDCTLIAHRAAIISSAAGPDGQTPSSGWSGGIMLRGSTNSTPGTPLGNGGNRYACIFSTVGNGTYFQDDTMSNAGGPYSSGNLGFYAWYQIQRVGDTFTTFVSSDGVTWIPKNTNTLSGIGTTIYAGMFSYAASSQNPNVHWAMFDGVSITGNVVGAPTVSVSPTTDTVYARQSATFTAMPVGLPPFSFQWQLNGASLAGATNATLALTDVTPASSGIYSVTASNSAGTVSAAATLMVLTPPPPSAVMISNSPLCYLRLNETAGPTAYDSVGSINGAGEGNVVFGVTGVTNSPFNGFERGNLGAQFDGSSSDIAVPALGVTTTNFTITGWVKRSGSQTDWSGLVFGRPGRGAGLMIVGNALRYSWNDNGSDYNWGSGLGLPDGQWTFFALTIEPTRAIIYMATNSTLRAATNNVSNSALSINSALYLGYDPNSSARRLNGALDEVAFYNRTLTRAQISEILVASQSAVPGVTLDSPLSGANFGSPATINLAASVVSNGRPINFVQFFNGPSPLGISSNAPYSLSWSNVAAGHYTLLAQVTYDTTNTQSSAPAFVTVSPIPSTPQNLSAVAVAANQVSLSWSVASDAVGYIVNRNGSPVASVSGTGWLDTGLTAATTYAYSIIATNAWGASPPSATNSVTTPATGNALAWDADASTTGVQDGSGNWGSSATNWWNGSAVVGWTDNSIATFGAGMAGGNTVTLTNDVTPAGITFTAQNGAYTLTSGGGGLNVSGAIPFNCLADGAVSAVIKGTGALRKTGSGVLALSGTNTFTGGTTISNGALQIINNCVLPGAIADQASLVINRSDSFNFIGVISGSGSVTKQNTGTLNFTNAAANTYSGGTVISGGTLSLGNYSTENVNSLGTGTVTVNSGGTLKFSPGSSGSTFNIPNAIVLSGGAIRSEDGVQKLNGSVAVNSAGGALQTVYSGKNLWISGAMSGAGSLTVDDASGSYGDGYVVLSADNTGFAGTITVKASSSGWSGGQISVNHNNALRNANLVMNTARDILFSGVTAPVFGSLAGSGNLTIPSGITLSIGNNNTNSDYSGAFLGSGALAKVGAGMLTLAGASSHSGATTISAGTLCVIGSLTNTVVTVANSGLLAGNGIVSGATIVQIGGTLAPGANEIGTLTFGSTLTLAGKTVMEISKSGLVLTNDLAAVMGALTYGGTLVVTNTSTNAAALGDTFKLFDAGSYNGGFASNSLPTLAAGLSWSTNALIVDGSITVAVSTYTLAYAAGANGTINGTTPQTITHGASGTAVTAAPNAGCYFVNWSDGQTANPRTDTAVTNSISVTANFAPFVIPVTSDSARNAEGYTFSFSGASGQPYTVLGATNAALPLSGWKTNKVGVFGPGGVARFTNSTPTDPAHFYRVRSP